MITVLLGNSKDHPSIEMRPYENSLVALSFGEDTAIYFSVEGLRRYSKVFASLADVMEKINEQ